MKVRIVLQPSNIVNPKTVFYMVAGIIIVAAILTRMFFARDVLECLQSIR